MLCLDGTDDESILLYIDGTPYIKRISYMCLFERLFGEQKNPPHPQGCIDKFAVDRVLQRCNGRAAAGYAKWQWQL